MPAAIRTCYVAIPTCVSVTWLLMLRSKGNVCHVWQFHFLSVFIEVFFFFFAIFRLPARGPCLVSQQIHPGTYVECLSLRGFGTTSARLVRRIQRTHALSAFRQKKNRRKNSISESHRYYCGKNMQGVRTPFGNNLFFLFSFLNL